MKHAILWSLLLVCGSLAQAQETTVTSLASTIGDAELFRAPNAQHLPPASQELLWTFESKGWAPIVQDIIKGRIYCSWADGQGGVIECPPEATGCAVFANDFRAAVGCIDEHNRVVGGLGLWRNR